jgi:hypothetical protein
MTKTMKTAYRMYRRKRTGVYYVENNQTREQQSLGTPDKGQAKRLLDAMNQGQQSSALNLQLGKTYITHADPKMATRTWQEAIDEMSLRGQAVSQARYAREFKSPAYAIIRSKPIIETTGDDLKAVLKRGGAATNNYLRRLHNLALDNGWIQWHIPSCQSCRSWPVFRKYRKHLRREAHGIKTKARGSTPLAFWFAGTARNYSAWLDSVSGLVDLRLAFLFIQ